MFPLEFYRWLHILGLVLIFSGLVGLMAARHGGRTPARAFDRGLAILHGFGMTFMLIGGFGALARLGMVSGWPWWIWVKLAIWLFLGGSMSLAKKRAHLGGKLIGWWLAAAAVAAYLGIFKPS